jgi:hypothetical protein
MKISDFIGKLGTFPPDDIVRFYCPVDNIYRTIWHISYSPLILEIFVTDPSMSMSDLFIGLFGGYNYADIIEDLTRLEETCPHSNEITIKIIDKRTNKLFSIIQ